MGGLSISQWFLCPLAKELILAALGGSLVKPNVYNVSLITSDALLIAHAYTISNVVDENGGVIGNHQEVNTFLRSHISAMSLPEDDFHVEELRSLLEHALQNTYKSRENDPKVTDAPFT